jgi:hypothetical protein
MTGSAARASNGCPVLGIDPFSAEFLGDAYPFHEQLREAGPVVWLERYECWGMARYEQVHVTLGLADLLLLGGRRAQQFPQGAAVASAKPASGGRSAAAYTDPRRAHPHSVSCSAAAAT